MGNKEIPPELKLWIRRLKEHGHMHRLFPPEPLEEGGIPDFLFSIEKQIKRMGE